MALQACLRTPQHRAQERPGRLLIFCQRFKWDRASRRRCGGRAVGFNFARYLQGPGTGITNFPSFSAIKFSVVLVELPFSSFFSIMITSFLVGLRLRQTFPLGPS